MKTTIFVFVFAFLLMTLGICFAEEPTISPLTGSYPISLISGQKALPVGTQVWANIGDGPCTYSHQQWPKGDKECFPRGKKEEYKHAIIIGHISADNLKPGDGLSWSQFRKGYWFYKIRIFFGISPDGEKIVGEAIVHFDEAMKFINLPPDFEEWSQYMIRMNW